MTATYNVLRDLKHDAEIAQALGNMIVAWSAAEIALQHTLFCITGLSWPMVGVMYYRIPTFESRTKIIRAMVDQWETKKYDPVEISLVIGKLSSLAVTRNGWIHGKWAVSLKDKSTVIFNHREKSGTADRRKPVTASAIKNHTEAVLKWMQRLIDLLPVKAG